MTERNVRPSVGVIIPAGGSGSRMGGVYKPMEKLCGKEMIGFCLETFENCPEVAFIVISAREDKVDEIKEYCKKCGYNKVKAVVAGGSDRQESVENAFGCGLFDDDSITTVAVHDAARPLLTVEMARNAFAVSSKKGNAVCAARVRDTVKRGDNADLICEDVDRQNLWLIQTPQVFGKGIFSLALGMAKQRGYRGTDESSLVTAINTTVHLCETPSYNIKVTYPEDVFLAECILKGREAE